MTEVGQAIVSLDLHQRVFCLQVGFGSGFKVNSAVWRALKDIKDSRHVAWETVSQAQVETMWSDLQGMGVKFVDGIIPPHKKEKKGT